MTTALTCNSAFWRLDEKMTVIELWSGRSWKANTRSRSRRCQFQFCGKILCQWNQTSVGFHLFGGCFRSHLGLARSSGAAVNSGC